ncbi:MAG: lamin tail domain-containing protein [Caldilineales bacterium]|nr:lamin tail domain-containing protein [Caldilineales bacterium]
MIPSLVHTLLLAALAFALLLSDHRSPRQETPSQNLFLPLQTHSAPTNATSHALISAFVPDGLAANDVDEAVAIQNVGRAWMSLAGWQLSDGEGKVVLPGISMGPGETIWCAQQAAAFVQVWAMAADCEYGKDTDPDIPNAEGSMPRLANNGDEVQLLDPAGYPADAVVYGSGDVGIEGWQGDAVQYYQSANRFSRSGQVFYRLFEPHSALPLADTDAQSDWAQGNPDPARGRRAAYPGWDLAQFSQAAHFAWPTTSPPPARLLIAPDNTFAAIQELFASARNQIVIEAYEFDHPMLVDALVDRARDGVEVRLLIEGAPVAGLTDDTRWAAQQIVEAGGDVRFMVNDVGDASDRYPYVHAKFAVVDGHTTLISTENFGLTSMPADAADGDTLGRRGYAILITDRAVAEAAFAVFAADSDPAHSDIFAWQRDHPNYGLPPTDYQPPTPSDQSGYPVRYPLPAEIGDAVEAYLFTSPESSLTPGPLLELIDQAGPGDVILSQQLYEEPFWGSADGSPALDPNPRLEAVIAAARRGATVRLLLDGYFDLDADTRSNSATIDYVNNLAATEGIDLQARLGNPTGAGIHAKLHLLRLGDDDWSVVSSINGGEVSNKLNREVALALRSAQGYDYFATVFWQDWTQPNPDLSTVIPTFPQK